MLYAKASDFLYLIHQFNKMNNSRAMRFNANGIEEWSALEWAGAMCGEAGECANACKKLRRMELSPDYSKNNFKNRESAIEAIASEAAGTFVYLALLCARLEIDLGDAIIKEFNRVSEREGFPEKFI